jgi:hypothetical protein
LPSEPLVGEDKAVSVASALASIGGNAIRHGGLMALPDT